jgi:histidinol-phosphatase (PHP family)
MLADHHLHLENRKGNESNSDYQNPAEYISQGKKRGVECFGFSDHAYIFSEAREINSNKWQKDRCKYAIDGYISTVKSIARNSEKIMMGLEIDYFPEKEAEIRKFIQQVDKKTKFDFFIGSIHWLGDWGFDLDEDEYQKEMKRRGIENAYQEYFEIVKKAIQSKLFSFIGHLDLIKIFGAIPKNRDYIQEIIEMLKKNGQAIEVNANGKNKPIQEFYPSREILKCCFDNGIDVTLGSDAHSPDRVGEYFEDVVGMLREVGYKEIVYFKQKEKKVIKI